MPFRLRAAVVAPIGAFALMIGVIFTASAETTSISGSAQGTAGDDVTRLLDVPFADPGYYVEGRNRYIYATGHDGTGGNAFRVSRYDAATGRYVYHFKTVKGWAGTCRRFEIELIDGTFHEALFQFTK